MLTLAVLLCIVALVLLLQAGRWQKDMGLPSGRVIYTDTRGWEQTTEPLYDAELGLTGKPDYLVQKGQDIIPVEVKSSRAPESPYDGHIFQVAAYCALVERVYGQRPAYGILHYPTRTFAIDYTPALEAALMDLLEEMHQQDRRKELARSHESPARCRGCGYRSVCEHKL